MTTAFYIKCVALSFLGLALAMLMQFKDKRDTAKVGNFVFSAKAFFGEEIITMAIGAIVIAIFILLIPNILGVKPEYGKWVQIGSVPIGYMGQDIIMKFFGVFKQQLNKAIDYKTDIADKENGTLGTPTPIK